jgi:ribose transport system permease protein
MATRLALPRLEAALAGLRTARWLAVLGGILLLGFVFSLLSPAFLGMRNLQNIAVQASVTGVMAAGMTFVIMTAGIDISVGATLYLSLVVANQLALNSTGPYAAYMVYPVSLGLATLLGFVNGLTANRLRINPLITTLATYVIYRGVATHITKARDIHPLESARFLGTGQIAGIPVPLLLVLAVVVAGALVLRYTRFGRYVLAVGASLRSARESGLPVSRIQVAVYTIAGACAGLGGLILLGRVGAVQNDMGIGIEFTVITAVVLGGTYLFGGRGSLAGSLLGAILLVMINNGLNLISASPYIYDIVRGVVLVGAVMLDRAAAAQLFRGSFALRGPAPPSRPKPRGATF